MVSKALPPFWIMVLPMAANGAISRSPGSACIMQRVPDRQICLVHYDRIEVIEMHTSEVRRIMTLCAGEAFPVDMLVMFA